MEYVINIFSMAAKWLAKLVGLPEFEYLLLVLMISVSGALCVGLIVKLFEFIKNPMLRIKLFIFTGLILVNVVSIVTTISRSTPPFGIGDVVVFAVLNLMLAGIYWGVTKGQNIPIRRTEKKSSDENH